jgi:hypothetical protein
VPSAVERQARRHSAMLRIRIDPTTAPRLHEGARDYRRLGDCMKRRESSTRRERGVRPAPRAILAFAHQGPVARAE